MPRTRPVASKITASSMLGYARSESRIRASAASRLRAHRRSRVSRASRAG